MERSATILANLVIGLGAGIGAYYGNETGGPQLIFAGGCMGAAIGYFVGWPIAEYFEPIFTWLLDDHAPWVIVPLLVLLVGVLFTLPDDESQCAGRDGAGVGAEVEVDGACSVPDDETTSGSQSH